MDIDIDFPDRVTKLAGREIQGVFVGQQGNHFFDQGVGLLYRTVGLASTEALEAFVKDGNGLVQATFLIGTIVFAQQTGSLVQQVRGRGSLSPANQQAQQQYPRPEVREG